ncbi:MAG: hypothetical protein N2037_11850 [Acidimicrobiales bacterium]|nr:hypothetical protein [Acidimicrobiales bacterium]
MSDQAELSSAATILEELTVRVVTVANRMASATEEGLAADLFEVERSLRAAQRRLLEVVGRLG